MLIPTGWIHAVVRTSFLFSFCARFEDSLLTILAKQQHTPEDSLVLGGNFLHFYNISTRKWLVCCLSISRLSWVCFLELRLRDIEIATEVPKKFRFPHFNKFVQKSPSFHHFFTEIYTHLSGYAGMWPNIIEKNSKPDKRSRRLASLSLIILPLRPSMNRSLPGC